MPDVLVTGASGFIGQHLVRTLLARGERVRALVRSRARAEPLAELGAVLVPGDVTQPESLHAAVAGCQVVFHLAGRITAPSLSGFLEVNELGTRHLAAVCAQQPLRPRLVVVSSLAAAGPAPPGSLRSEAEPPQPVSHYGRSKLAGERAAAEYADRLSVSIVRPPIVFGPADRATLIMFRPIVRHGVQLLIGGRDTRYSLIHVDDLCAGLVRVAERGQTLPVGENPHGVGVYYLADPDPRNLLELGQEIAHAAGQGVPRRIHVPAWLVWTAATCGQIAGWLRGKMGHVNVDKAREALAGNWTCSVERARSELDFAPAFSLTERLRATTLWYRERGWL
jgi:nucleoside-diphosphate-sugar epimerase